MGIDLQAGNYYRRKADNAVVKVLRIEVWPYECTCGAPGTECEAKPMVLYRLNDDEYPHRTEVVDRERFENEFDGDLIWDTVLRKFV